MTTGKSKVEIKVTPANLRLRHIADQEVQGTHPMRVKERSEALVVKRVESNILLYRMANGRTVAAQLEAIANEALDPDFFTANQENESAQARQHDILAAQSKNEKGNIYKELRTVKEQREALIVTDLGIVVNGNRRLAAMRELWAADPDEYKKFKYVDVAVLPGGITESDIVSIEDELQLTAPTKLDYDWVSTALTLRNRLNGASEAEREAVVRRWRRTDKEAEEILGMIMLVDMYLNQHLQKPYAYDEVIDKEQNFLELYRLRANHNDKRLIDADTQIVFQIMEQSRSFGDRSYMVVRSVADIRNKLMEDIVLTESQHKPSDSNTILNRLASSAPSKGGYNDDIIAVLEDRLGAGTTETVELIRAAYAEVKSESDTVKSKKRPLQLAQSANKSLQEITLADVAPEDYLTLKSQLESTVSRAQSLLQDPLISEG